MRGSDWSSDVCSSDLDSSTDALRSSGQRRDRHQFDDVQPRLLARIGNHDAPLERANALHITGEITIGIVATGWGFLFVPQSHRAQNYLAVVAFGPVTA